MKTFRVGRALALALVTSSIAVAQQGTGAQGTSQYPIADKIADKLIQKYQTSSCQQLAQEKMARSRSFRYACSLHAWVTDPCQLIGG
jgi:hypothetical protein